MKNGEYNPSSTAWMVEASCTKSDPEIFFSEYNPTATYEAKEMCQKCTVRLACLAFAMQDDELKGIWGGMTTTERKKLRKKDKLIKR